MNGTTVFDFSVVMAVYNSMPYLQEACQSLIAQDLGFEKIQLILVDDGSADESGIYCDQLAKEHRNVCVIHQKNAGPAAARNNGIESASGRYVCFMDSDDKVSKDCFRKVLLFFDAHADETDMVTIPIEFFDSQTGPHWQNSKFEQGSRVIDLTKEWNVQVTSSSSTFFKREALNGKKFDQRLSNSEDFKLDLQILLENPKLGVVSDCTYFYRRRATKNSIIQGMFMKKAWYTSWFHDFVDEIVAQSKAQCGRVPEYVQYAILCDLLWRFKTNYDHAIKSVLSESEIQQYLTELRRVLQYFDDPIYMVLPTLPDEFKCFMLSFKHDRMPSMHSTGSADVTLRFDNHTAFFVSMVPVVIERVTIENGHTVVDGYFDVFGYDSSRLSGISCVINNETNADVQLWKTHETKRWFGLTVFERFRFEAIGPLSEKTDLHFFCTVDGNRVLMKNLLLGTYIPMNRSIVSGVSFIGPWKYFITADTIRFLYRPGWVNRVKAEIRTWVDLWRVNKPGMHKAIAVRGMYYFCSLFHRRPVWIISDRVGRAGDNGEAIFRYITQHHASEVKACYVLDRNSVDYDRMKKIGTVVPYFSRKHQLMQMLAECSLSSSGFCMLQAPFQQEEMDWYKDLYIKPLVFLQHGITKDDQSKWLNRYGHNIYGFVTSARPEYEEISDNKRYYYHPEEVWLTGMPRFDRLYNKPDKTITVMPTWRQYLMGSLNHKSATWQIDDTFTKSDYVKFYTDLLTNPRLINSAEELGYTLQFFPHPVVLQHIDVFHLDPRVKILREDVEYKDVYAESAMVISDYSSAVFDFAYLKKPILYAQFDADTFFSGEHVYQKGYFDYQRDGFGEVTHTLEETVDLMIQYMRSGCVMKDQYKERVNRFFAFDDQENCRRVYEKTWEMNRRIKALASGSPGKKQR